MGIFGTLALGVVVVIVEFIIQGCHDDSSYIPTCLLAVLLYTGLFAISWGYGGCNVLLAYCVFQIDKMDTSSMQSSYEMKPIQYSNIK